MKLQQTFQCCQMRKARAYADNSNIVVTFLYICMYVASVGVGCRYTHQEQGQQESPGPH